MPRFAPARSAALFFALVAALSIGCSSDNGGDRDGDRFSIEDSKGVGWQESEALCSAYCDLATGCDASGFTDRCRADCRAALAGSCGRQRAMYYQCELDLGCDNDECVYDYGPCTAQLYAICRDTGPSACGPDTATGQACAPPASLESQDCGRQWVACFYSGGDCDADWATEQCLIENRINGLPCALSDCVDGARTALLDYTSFSWCPPDSCAATSARPPYSLECASKTCFNQLRACAQIADEGGRDACARYELTRFCDEN